ncbi:MAG: hemolysin III family protein [Acidobacteriia bacterium]|nr:hemolysin III family protein [Terriglobia bacterium]
MRMHPEEIANSLTHGAGLVLSLAGLVVLVVVASVRGTALNIVSCCVYGATLVLLYGASTVYHSVVSPRWKHVLRIVDHCCIYLLIAGTYTPFTLVILRGSWGWTLFGVVWGLALAGVLFKVWFVEHFPIGSVVLYVLMGWLAVIAIRPLMHAAPLSALGWILAGGLFYTTGVIFFGWERLRYNHAVWHIFVLAGSICHYVAVLLYVAPVRA